MHIYKNSLILRVCMTDDYFPHKSAFINYFTSFLKKTDAAKITLLPFFFKIFPIFPIVVVFPTPLTPEIRIVFKEFLFKKKSFFSKGEIKFTI